MRQNQSTFGPLTVMLESFSHILIYSNYYDLFHAVKGPASFRKGLTYLNLNRPLATFV